LGDIQAGPISGLLFLVVKAPANGRSMQGHSAILGKSFSRSRMIAFNPVDCLSELEGVAPKRARQTLKPRAVVSALFNWSMSRLGLALHLLFHEFQPG